MLAASLRADTADLQSFVEGLAVKLEASFPSRVRVERRGGFLGGRKRVALLAARLGDHEYVLENDEGEVACTRRSIVHGVALKSERPRLSAWIDQLAQDLVTEAKASEDDRVVLQRLLGA